MLPSFRPVPVSGQKKVNSVIFDGILTLRPPKRSVGKTGQTNETIYHLCFRKHKSCSMERFLDQKCILIQILQRSKNSIVLALGHGSFCVFTTKIRSWSLIPTCKFPLVTNLSGWDVKAMSSNVLEQLVVLVASWITFVGQTELFDEVGQIFIRAVWIMENYQWIQACLY